MFENHSETVALKHVRKLVDLQDEWGLLEMGFRHTTGKSVPKRQDKAIFYLKQVADLDGKLSAIACFNIGAIYLRAESAKATPWFKVSAEKGYGAAQYNYGLSLVEGWNGEVDETAGLEWIERAAMEGVYEAKKYTATT